MYRKFSTFLKHLQPIIDYVYTGVKGNMFLKIVFWIFFIMIYTPVNVFELFHFQS